MASMVVNIVNERDAGTQAHGKEIFRPVDRVIVFQRDALPGTVGEPIQVAAKLLQCCALVAISASSVNIRDIRIDQFRHFGLIFNLLQRGFNYLWARRVEHYELIRMEREAKS